MVVRVLVMGLVALCACGEHRAPPRDVPHDAPRAIVQPDRPPAAVISDLGDMHLDEATPRHTGAASASPHASRPIDVTLHSTPPGAEVLVDGVYVGVTPTFWNGQADGREHEFVFMRRGHATARYRFVPVTSGVIHARLERMSEEPDAGVDDGTSLPGAALPGAGSVLVNPPPAPVVLPKADASWSDAPLAPAVSDTPSARTAPPP
jgi:hypothetical protein